MKKLLTMLFVALTLTTGAAYADADKQSPLTEKQATQLLQSGKLLYSCPTHQHVFSDKEGKCLICGMDLRKASAIQEGKAATFSANNSMMMEKK
ncbi:MAG: heavy metal-binding domain-containing protein [Rickettsiales bacterium]